MKARANSKADMLTCCICGTPTTWKIVEIIDEVLAFCSAHENYQQAAAYKPETAR